MSQQLVLISPEDLKKTIEVAVSKVLSKKLEVKEKESESTSKVLMLRQAAEYIQMPIPTFRERLARNEIKGAKIGKSWRFFPEDLDEFIKKNLRKTNDEIEQEIDDELSK
ncbi:helix-turn-helix domain-containing protein [Labilibaculum sp. DW002]|uniref:Helix-turn-helix domain-containing protein n=1 Tax=Paralabilibaculum antarcticum TaxID=2912572 RepID=A0ABT5VST6_9BACT|nr:helix-turn-helix domain-containing protein [Labilibaculum sp. DW002]MDE5418491.1 helix-turn-helix domain-containing protein [Labilibaculum sp. DW002]